MIKNIPKGIATRLTSISADEETFNIHKEPYVEALKKAGHKEDLVYRKEVAPRIINEAASKEPGVCKKKRKKGHNITYFNPPFSMLLQTNLTRQLNKIIQDCFLKGHPLSKIINRNTVQV